MTTKPHVERRTSPPLGGTARHVEPSPVDLTAAPGRRWFALTVVCLGVVLVVADNTIVNVALPTLSTELGASLGGLQWMVDAYLLAFAGLLLPFGALGDRIGRKKVMVAGLAVLGAASGAAATTDHLATLIGCRVVMGVGAALVFPATLSIVTAMFPPGSERKVAVAIWSATVGVGVIVGPLLGGFLLDHAWWGSVFLVNVPVALVAIVLTVAVVPGSRDASAARLDPVGAGLSFAAVTSFVFAIIEAPTHGWLSGWTLGGAASAAGLAWLFVRWESAHPSPIVPTELVRKRAFATPVLVLTLATSALFGFVFVATQYLQIVTGLGAFASGLRYLPFAVALIVTAIASPRLAARYGAGALIATGMVVVTAAMLLTLTLDRSSGFLPVVGPLIALLGVGMGLVTAPATDLMMAQVPADQVGVGSGMNDTARQLGGALGVAALGSVFSSTFSSTLRAEPVVRQLDAATVDAIASSPALGRQYALVSARDPQLLDAVLDAFVAAMHRAASVGAAAALAGGLLAVVLLGSDRSAAPERRSRPAFPGRSGPARVRRVTTN